MISAKSIKSFTLVPRVRRAESRPSDYRTFCQLHSKELMIDIKRNDFGYHSGIGARWPPHITPISIVLLFFLLWRNMDGLDCGSVGREEGKQYIVNGTTVYCTDDIRPICFRFLLTGHVPTYCWNISYSRDREMTFEKSSAAELPRIRTKTGLFQERITTPKKR